MNHSSRSTGDPILASSRSVSKDVAGAPVASREPAGPSQEARVVSGHVDGVVPADQRGEQPGERSVHVDPPPVGHRRGLQIRALDQPDRHLLRKAEHVFHGSVEVRLQGHSHVPVAGPHRAQHFQGPFDVLVALHVDHHQGPRRVRGGHHPLGVLQAELHRQVQAQLGELHRDVAIEAVALVDALQGQHIAHLQVAQSLLERVVLPVQRIGHDGADGRSAATVRATTSSDLFGLVRNCGFVLPAAKWCAGV
jgi:hypothetical protein